MNACRMRFYREEEMLQMNQVDQIKELQREGYGPTEIAKRLKVDRKTVSHYMNQEDFNASVEVAKREPSKLDRFNLISRFL